jgi:hypothetical protein
MILQNGSAAYRCFDQHGNQAPLRKLIDSEYLGERGIFSWKYEVDLSPLKDRNATAHASWISSGKGLIMLGDVLPTTPMSGIVKLRAPAGWQILYDRTVRRRRCFQNIRFRPRCFRDRPRLAEGPFVRSESKYRSHHCRTLAVYSGRSRRNGERDIYFIAKRISHGWPAFGIR